MPRSYTVYRGADAACQCNCGTDILLEQARQQGMRVSTPEVAMQLKATLVL